MNVSGTSLRVSMTNIHEETTNPIWAFVIFQTNRSNKQKWIIAYLIMLMSKTCDLILVESVTLKTVGS